MIQKKWYERFRIKVLSDMLKEKDKYSQGRVYLLVSVLAYYVTLGVLTYNGIRKSTEIDLTIFKDIISALQWSIGLFAGYAFGGKALDVLKLFVTKQNETKTEEVV